MNNSPVPTAPVSSATPRAFTAALHKVLKHHEISGALISTKITSFEGLGFGSGATATIEIPKDALVSDAALRDLEATRQAFRATAGGPAFDPAKEGRSSSFLVYIKQAYKTTPKDELFVRKSTADQAAFGKGVITTQSLLEPTAGGSVSTAQGSYLLIHWVAAHGRLNEVPAGLLTRELLTVKDSKQSTPLHDAARMGYLHAVPCLADLVIPADLVSEDGHGYTPLQFALRSAYHGEQAAMALPETLVREALALANDPKLTDWYEELRLRGSKAEESADASDLPSESPKAASGLSP